MYRLITICICLLNISLLTSCTKEKEILQTISSEKQLLSFSLNLELPYPHSLSTTIDQGTHTAQAVIGLREEYMQTTATFRLSPKATIDPNPAESRLDYSKPVTFTITAEDKSTLTYTVNISREVLKITALNKTQFDPGEIMEITGEGFQVSNSSSTTSDAYLLTSYGQLYPLELAAPTTSTSIKVKIPEVDELEYQVKVFATNDVNVIYTAPINIVYKNRAPRLDKVTPTKYLKSGEPPLYEFRIFILGKFLNNAKFTLVKANDESQQTALTDLTTKSGGNITYGFEFKIPNTIFPGEYYLEANCNGTKVRYAQKLTYPW